MDATTLFASTLQPTAFADEELQPVAQQHGEALRQHNSKQRKTAPQPKTSKKKKKKQRAAKAVEPKQRTTNAMYAGIAILLLWGLRTAYELSHKSTPSKPTQQQQPPTGALNSFSNPGPAVTSTP
eukprot:CAMPEP_0198127242 /NCGR_PEP_ID=MMETSP1442-20131203/46731_1 /TAXON_ID= /ORGANISM="Craspedostauros australis, Strain CCMP3328" /LENGTH=124 /DNA_ID=CAMNT_0043787183 /DNA_START=155 /DNA_END=529 /DNA_ORIENTATION=+